MLDTNTVSHLIKQQSVVVRRVIAASMASLCISAFTAGELLYGLAKRSGAVRLHLAVGEFLRRVDVVSWDTEAAKRYGGVRGDMERVGKILAPLDMLIAAHALSGGMVLVTNDRTFRQVGSLGVEDWTN